MAPHTYLGLLRFFLTVGGGLGGQIFNFPLECSAAFWQDGFVVVEKFFSTLMSIYRRVLNELTLGIVTTTTTSKSFHNLVTLRAYSFCLSDLSAERNVLIFLMRRGHVISPR